MRPERFVPPLAALAGGVACVAVSWSYRALVAFALFALLAVAATLVGDRPRARLAAGVVAAAALLASPVDGVGALLVGALGVLAVVPAVRPGAAALVLLLGAVVALAPPLAWPRLADARLPAISLALAALLVASCALVAAWRTRPAAAILLALLVCPLAIAQQVEPADVSIDRLTVSPEPVVGVASIAAAHVRNTGAVAAVVTVDFSYADGAPLVADGAAASSLTRTVPSGATLRFELEFTPRRERRGDADVVAVASSAQDGVAGNERATQAVLVRDPALVVAFDAPAGLDVPGDGMGFVRLRVRNDGNANDTPQIALDVAAPWRATLPGVLGPLAPGENATLDLLVTPHTADPSRQLWLNATVRSSIRPTLEWRAAAPPLRPNASSATLARAPELELALLEQVFANETVEGNLTVRNVGLLPDVYFLNATLGASPGWNVTLLDDRALAGAPSPLRVALAPGERATLRVAVARLAQTSPEAMLVLNASSVNARALGGAAANATLARSIRAAAPDLAVVALDAPTTAYAGDGAAFLVRIANVGRVASPGANVTCALADAARVFAEDVLPVAPLAPAAEATVAWRPATDGFRGTLAGTCRLVAPAGDATAGNDAANATVRVRSPVILPRAPERISVVPGARLSLPGGESGLSVENRGDEPETVEVLLRSEATWLAAAWRVEVPARAEAALPLDLVVPPRLDASTVRASIAASVVGRPEFGATVEIIVDIDDREPPSIEIVEPAANGTRARSSWLVVRAEDALGIARGEALVVAPDGTRTLLPLELNATNGNYAAAFTPLYAGEHRFEWRFQDASPAANLATRVTSWSVDLPPYGGLAPLGFEDGGVVSSRHIRFVEVDPGSTRQATVDLGQGPAPLAFPYDVEAATWADGPHRVVVRAVSLEGASWERAWTLTLDTLPPAVAETRIDPLADGRVRLVVRAPEATEAVAQWQTPRGPVEVALASQGRGEFAAVAPPPEAWSSVTFLVEDGAGNVASASVRPGSSETPGVGTGGLVAGLVLAGLAGRRSGADELARGHGAKPARRLRERHLRLVREVEQRGADAGAQEDEHHPRRDAGVARAEDHRAPDEDEDVGEVDDEPIPRDDGPAQAGRHLQAGVDDRCPRAPGPGRPRDAVAWGTGTRRDGGWFRLGLNPSGRGPRHPGPRRRLASTSAMRRARRWSRSVRPPTSWL